MMKAQTPISEFNTQITEDYLKLQPENQYFERKGLGEKDTKPSKIAQELIGMLNADGGTLVFGVSDSGEIQALVGTNHNVIRDLDAIYRFKKI